MMAGLGVSDTRTGKPAPATAVLGRAAALGAATGLRSAIALAAALAAAKVGHDARAALARRLPDPVVAVAEDAVAIGLAALGS